MSNVPDDWGIYYQRCAKCGYNAHASENYACECIPCEADGCEDITDGGKYCSKCKEDREERLILLLSKRTVSWKTIKEEGHDLREVLLDAQRRKDWNAARKCSEAVRRMYKGEK